MKNAICAAQQDFLSNISTIMDTCFSAFHSDITHTQKKILQTQKTKIKEALAGASTVERRGIGQMKVRKRKR